MSIASCLACGVRFDMARAGKCDGHRPRSEMLEDAETGRMIRPFRREYCLVCPLGHALHDSPGWWRLPTRQPTLDEKKLGLEWVLAEVDP